MEQHPKTLKSDMNGDWEILEAQIRECYGRVVYAHKAHEKNADLYLARLRRTKLFQILLSTITTGGIFGVLFSNGSKALEFITASTATTQLFVNTYIKEYSLSETAERHSVTASKLWSIRERYLSLLADLISRQITLEDARQIRENLQQELVVIYEKAPRTIPKAYKEAQMALKMKEELTFTDKEIDLFLPKPLKKNRNT